MNENVSACHSNLISLSDNLTNPPQIIFNTDSATCEQLSYQQFANVSEIITSGPNVTYKHFDDFAEIVHTGNNVSSASQTINNSKSLNTVAETVSLGATYECYSNVNGLNDQVIPSINYELIDRCLKSNVITVPISTTCSTSQSVNNVQSMPCSSRNNLPDSIQFLSDKDLQVLNLDMISNNVDSESVKQCVNTEILFIPNHDENVLYSTMNSESQLPSAVNYGTIICKSETPVEPHNKACLSRETKHSKQILKLPSKCKKNCFVKENKSMTRNINNSGKEKQKKVEIFWNDMKSLPEKMKLPLPSYCKCQTITINNARKIDAQSYVKNNKTLVLHHVGRVVIQNIEFCSFKRNETLYVSRSQLDNSNLLPVKANRLLQKCGKTFPSFADRLLIEEKEYMMQNKLISKNVTKHMLFSVGFVRWLYDYLCRSTDDTRQTAVFEKFLGHQCASYQQLSVPHLTCNLVRKANIRNKSKKHGLKTNFVIKSDNGMFKYSEIGRICFDDKVIAAFKITESDDSNTFVNYYQFTSYLRCVSAVEFNNLVQNFQCVLVDAPDEVIEHFKNLEFKISEDFHISKWIEVNGLKAVCSYLMGKIKVPSSVSAVDFIVRFAVSKTEKIFGMKLKDQLLPVTFPEHYFDNPDILSIAAAEIIGASQDGSQNENFITIEPLDSSQEQSQSMVPFDIPVISPDKACATVNDITNHVTQHSDMYSVLQSSTRTKGRNTETGKFRKHAVATKSPSTNSGSSINPIVVIKTTAAIGTQTNISKNIKLPVFKPKTKKVSTTIALNSKMSDKTNTNSCEAKEIKTCTLTKSALPISVRGHDLLQSSFDVGSSDSYLSEQLQFDDSASRTKTPINSQQEFNCKNNDPKVTVIANNNGGDILECIPLFSLSDIMQNEEEPLLHFINPYSPLNSPHNPNNAGKLNSESLKTLVHPQNLAKPTPQLCLDSFSESLGPMMHHETDSDTVSKTLNRVILGDNLSVSDFTSIMGSPQKIKNTTSIFDTPKTSPNLDRSRSICPQSLCQTINQQEKRSTPDISPHFLAEIISTAEYLQQDNNIDASSTDSENRSTSSGLSQKTLKDISRIRKCFREMAFCPAEVINNKWKLKVRLEKKFKSDTVHKKLKIHRMLKLVALFLSKTWVFSELQKRMAVLKGKQVAENQKKGNKTETALCTKENSTIQMPEDRNFSSAKVCINFDEQQKKSLQKMKPLNGTKLNGVIKSVSETKRHSKDSATTQISDNKIVYCSDKHSSVACSINIHDNQQELQTGTMNNYSVTHKSVNDNYIDQVDYNCNDVTSCERSYDVANLDRNNLLCSMDAVSRPIINRDLETMLAVESITSMDSDLDSAGKCVGKSNVLNVDSKHIKNTVPMRVNKIDSVLKRDNLLNGKVTHIHKRLRKKPDKFVDYADLTNVKLPIKRRSRKRPIKNNSFSLPKYQKCDDSLLAIEPNNEVLLFVPTNYGNKFETVNETIEYIPSSKFKQIPCPENKKTIAQLLHERDNNHNDIAKKRYYPQNNTAIHQIHNTIKQNRKSLAGNCIGESSEDGKKYEIFQSV